MNRLGQVPSGATLFMIMILLCFFASGCAQKKLKNEIFTQLERQSFVSLERLYTESSSALELSKIAKGILVFPKVSDIGFMLGGQHGEGAMLVDGKLYGYYNISSAYFGWLLFGSQSYSIAMFIMTDNALYHLQKSSSWQFGAGLKTVFAGKGIARSGTMNDDVYVFIYGQKGMMLDLGRLEGTMIRKIENQ